MLILKKCNTCGEFKELKDFSKSKRYKDGYTNKCNLCKQEYDREYYKSRYSNKGNVERRRTLKKQNRDRNARYIYAYLQKHPCEVCGETDPVVLEFDHLDDSGKRFNISDSKERSLDSIKVEITKCRVLCANCHRRRTAKQLGWYSNI